MKLLRQEATVHTGWMLLLFVLVLVSACLVLTKAWQVRQQVNQLGQARIVHDRAQAEWGKLLLEQSTWTAHARIEVIAHEQIGMRVPEPGEIRMINP